MQEEILDSHTLPSRSTTSNLSPNSLKHTFFVALNREVVLRTMYEGGTSNYQILHGLRILAIDGSKVQLPTNAETRKVFGCFDCHSPQSHGQGSKVGGEHSYGLASVLYDVLNRAAVDAVLAHSHSYEVDLAAGHLAYTEDNDLVIYDRGYWQ